MATARNGKRGRLGTVFGAIAGLFSGAFLMYLTPLVERVFKPSPPLANFEARPDGLTVHFHNLSSGKGLEGWWDFGDGSPLVPLVTDSDLSHAYPKPGGYAARLSVRNILGEANERSVTLSLDAPETESPRILQFDAVSVTPESQAPATFKVAGEVKNAKLAVWDLDEGRPLEVTAAPSGKVERLVTFQKPGGYVIKLAAFNGLQHEEKSVAVKVKPAPAGSLAVVLIVTDRATLVERVDRPFVLGASFPPDARSDSVSISPWVNAPTGWNITDVLVSSPQGKSQSMQGRPALALDAAALKAGPGRNLSLQRDLSGKTVRLTGELVRSSKKDLPALALPVVLREERRKPVAQQQLPVMAALSLPGTTQLLLPSLPAGWESPRRQIRFELREGNRLIWQGNDLPSGVLLTLNQRRCVLTASQAGDRVTVNLKEIGGR